MAALVCSICHSGGDVLVSTIYFGFHLRAELQIVQLRPVIIASVCSVNLLSIGVIQDLLAHLRPHQLILRDLFCEAEVLL